VLVGQGLGFKERSAILYKVYRCGRIMKIVVINLLLYCLILHFSSITSKKYLFPTKSQEERKENGKELMLFDQFNSLFDDEAVFASKEQKEKFKDRFISLLLRILSVYDLNAASQFSDKVEVEEEDGFYVDLGEEDLDLDDVTSTGVEHVRNGHITEESNAEHKEKSSSSSSSSVDLLARIKPPFRCKELLRRYNPEIYNITGLFKQQISSDLQMALSYLPVSIKESLLTFISLLQQEVTKIKQKLTLPLRGYR
jgi:hypothetical protein